MDRQSATRLLSTSARVYPPYLPYLHQVSRTRTRSLRWLSPLAAAMTAGYAMATYREMIARRPSFSSSSASSYSAPSTFAQQHHHHHTSALTAEQIEAERLRRRETAMAEAYGDRSSLEELQRAMAVYEAQRGAR
ncbi:hypothetical protein VTH82DRAFT_4730 [Thermothelomyces myriococcoides]